VNCLHVLLETFAVRKHLVADVALLGFGPGGHAGCQGVQVDHRVVLQLAHLVEALVADVAHELLEVEVGLVVRLQDLREHRPVVAAGRAHQHVTVMGVAPPQVGGQLPPPLAPHLTADLWAPEATGYIAWTS